MIVYLQTCVYCISANPSYKKVKCFTTSIKEYNDWRLHEFVFILFDNIFGKKLRTMCFFTLVTGFDSQFLTLCKKDHISNFSPFLQFAREFPLSKKT